MHPGSAPERNLPPPARSSSQPRSPAIERASCLRQIPFKTFRRQPASIRLGNELCRKIERESDPFFVDPGLDDGLHARIAPCPIWHRERRDPKCDQCVVSVSRIWIPLNHREETVDHAFRRGGRRQRDQGVPEAFNILTPRSFLDEIDERWVLAEDRHRAIGPWIQRRGAFPQRLRVWVRAAGCGRAPRMPTRHRRLCAAPALGRYRSCSR